jgi:aryl-alcohol dehydrogenase-like predicted oxidoreductase
MTSQVGFGCYRVAAGSIVHAQALEAALTQGINLIDTSANYGDGGSETLVGEVLERLIAAGRLRRQALIVVSKAGYIQGSNYALSRQRGEEGRPFADLVPFADGLEHCIHPEFLADQLDRSLERLGLKALDVYLLHNPEYYLGWAARQGIGLEASRAEYRRRIDLAFRYLEQEVARGRIGCYGISSNTFPSTPDDVQFTSLSTVWSVAESLAAPHHFRVIQLPLNLLETGGVLEVNQPGNRTVLQFASEKGLGVLVNRPLNAFGAGRLVRLAEGPQPEAAAPDAVEQRIDDLSASEETLQRRILPRLSLSAQQEIQLREWLTVGPALRQHWRRLDSPVQWEEVRDRYFLPRLQGGFEFLSRQRTVGKDLQTWVAGHRSRLDAAFHVVESAVAVRAALLVAVFKDRVRAADPDWNVSGTLSQLAVRALRSTAGVSAVLVGMRREAYVQDMLAELRRPVDTNDRRAAWLRLAQALKSSPAGD